MLEPSLAFTATSQDPNSDRIPRDPDGEFWTQRTHLIPDLLSIIDAHIRRVCRIESIAGNHDAFDGRAAIEPHEQNLSAPDRDFLVDAARDLHDALAADRPGIASGFVESWTASPWPILKRLAIHARAERTDIPADDRLDWLLQQNGWVTDTSLHHEVMRLIARAVHQASEDRIEALIQAITHDDSPDISWLIFNRLSWIVEHAPNSPTAKSAFAEAQAAQPESAMSEHPDHLRWIEISSSSSELEPIVPPEHLAADLVSDASAAVAALLAYAEPTETEDERPYRWDRALMAAADATELQPLGGIELLEALVESADNGSAPVRSLARNVLTTLNSPQVRSQLTSSDRDRTRRVLRNVWDTVEHIWEAPSEAFVEHGWHHVAINNWAGKITELAVHIALTEVRSRSVPGGGLLPVDRELLERILESDSPAARVGQTMCARYLAPFHAADRDWASGHLMPLMDPTEGEQRSVRCWDAYLADRRWNPELLQDGLLDRFHRFAEHADQCCAEARRAFAFLSAELCVAVHPDTPIGSAIWLTGFTSAASEATRAAFINAVALQLQTEDSQAISAQWHGWMHDYWLSRLEGIPRPLNESESGALAGWVILLDENAPAAVDLACRAPTPLPQDSFLFTEVYSVNQGTGHFIRFVEHHPHEATRFMAHLLQNTSHDAARNIEMIAGYFIQALKDRVDEATFEPVRTELDRLGWTHSPR
ncbi:DUF4020 domain-containing protein [Candidatus Poriferisodalis sp.]|uniref:DUF4020 domain-containing protein n=1 Tax=Candidatus Poriferisodalis sp. TaxID=3101277 RepID=UPI003C705473